MSKYKVGDKVRISREITNQLLLGDMAHWLGKIVTISVVKVYRNNLGVGYEVKENQWTWDEENLELVKESTQESTQEAQKEMVNHPSHYNTTKYECIDEMIALFGFDDVEAFCKCNVYKYRYRASNKNGDEDIKKSEWYMSKLIWIQSMTTEEKRLYLKDLLEMEDDD